MATVPSPELEDMMHGEKLQERQDRLHQPLELYYTFNSEADRNKAKSLVESERMHNKHGELLLHLTGFQNDTHPERERAADGLALYFDRYNESLLLEVEKFFESSGIKVAHYHEFVVTPDVQRQRAEELMEKRRAFEAGYQTLAEPERKDNVRQMPPQPESKPKDRAAAA
jgi:hypothetical protein